MTDSTASLDWTGFGCFNHQPLQCSEKGVFSFYQLPIKHMFLRHTGKVKGVEHPSIHFYLCEICKYIKYIYRTTYILFNFPKFKSLPTYSSGPHHSYILNTLAWSFVFIRHI